MRSIWVFLRRNVVYLYSKNLILINFFTVKVSGCSLHANPGVISHESGMMSLGEFLVQKNKGKLICNSPNDIISANFGSEKVDQDGIFYYNNILHFFFE
jgi:hypothetical protein